jgi:hypothetical protein
LSKRSAMIIAFPLNNIAGSDTCLITASDDKKMQHITTLGIALLAGSSRALLVQASASHCIALAPVKCVSFASDDGSISTESRTEHSIDLGTPNQVCLPESPNQVCLPEPPWIPAGAYFQHCVQSIFEDLVKAATYPGFSCCAWHRNVHELERVLRQMKSRRCTPLWMDFDGELVQCESCQALLDSPESGDRCWLCEGEIRLPRREACTQATNSDCDSIAVRRRTSVSLTEDEPETGSHSGRCHD